MKVFFFGNDAFFFGVGRIYKVQPGYMERVRQLAIEEQHTQSDMT